jgi:hypothetical protein
MSGIAGDLSLSGSLGVSTPCPRESDDGTTIEMEERFERENWIDERQEGTGDGESPEERARYVFILSSVTVLYDVGSSSKGDAILYKAIGGCVPKSCEATFSWPDRSSCGRPKYLC